jgi:hypothetical protein
MRGKLWFIGGLAAGFVLGARAGREKYEEMVRNTRKVLDHPTVQEAAGVVQAQASRLYAEGKETITDKLGHTRLGEKLNSHRELAADEALAGAASGTTGTTGTGTTTGTSKGASSAKNTNTF